MLNTLLYLGLRWSDSKLFFPLHFFVSLCYRNMVMPILQCYLTTRHKCIRHIFCCHSVLTSHFNCFGSDLDYSVIIDDEADQHKIDMIVRDVIKLKKKFHFLDFPYIFRLGEYTLQLRLKDQYPVEYSLIELFKNLRKISWGNEKYQMAQTAYHKYKASRSIRQCFIRMGMADHRQDRQRGGQLHKININQWDQLRIERVDILDNPQEMPVLFSYHLNLDFFLSLVGDNEIKLNMAAITPEDFPCHKLTGEISRLRRIKSIQRHFKIQVFENLLLCLSTLRTRSYPHHLALKNPSRINDIVTHLGQLQRGGELAEISGMKQVIKRVAAEINKIKA